MSKEYNKGALTGGDATDGDTSSVVKKSSVLNFLKDKVIRIILLQGDGNVKEGHTKSLLEEVDDVVKKSELFKMTELASKKLKEDEQTQREKNMEDVIESVLDSVM